MKTEMLLRRLKRRGFHISQFGNDYQIIAGRVAGFFQDCSGRAAFYETTRLAVEDQDYDPAHLPQTRHYKPTTFIAALASGLAA